MNCYCNTKHAELIWFYTRVRHDYNSIIFFHFIQFVHIYFVQSTTFVKQYIYKCLMTLIDSIFLGKTYD